MMGPDGASLYLRRARLIGQPNIPVGADSYEYFGVEIREVRLAD